MCQQPIPQAFVHRFDVFYWRDRNDEVDFVLKKKNAVIAIEVKSNNESNTTGLKRFKDLFSPQKAIIVGNSGIPAEDFLTMDVRKLFE